jgi:hypothetical protein
MRVQIKSKGQFYGCIGTVAKILNQHQIVVKIDGLQGYYTFGHRSVRLIDAGVNIENHVAKQAKEKLQAEIDFTQEEIIKSRLYDTLFSSGYRSAMRTMNVRLESILNGKA